MRPTKQNRIKWTKSVERNHLGAGGRKVILIKIKKGKSYSLKKEIKGHETASAARTDGDRGERILVRAGFDRCRGRDHGRDRALHLASRCCCANAVPSAAVSVTLGGLHGCRCDLAWTPAGRTLVHAIAPSLVPALAPQSPRGL